MSYLPNDQWREDMYEKVLDKEDFINELWNRYGVTDKVWVLLKSGWTVDDIIQEYVKKYDIKDEATDMDDDS